MEFALWLPERHRYNPATLAQCAIGGPENVWNLQQTVLFGSAYHQRLRIFIEPGQKHQPNARLARAKSLLASNPTKVNGGDSKGIRR